jgi:nicotinic acid phosphoribosyltransferase
MLTGKGEAAALRTWIEEHGNETKADIDDKGEKGVRPVFRKPSAEKNRGKNGSDPDLN